MSALLREQVTDVQHWNNTLFSFKTTRSPGLRFKNGHFIMIGLELEGKPLMRAYSIASANHEEELEFFSIKVPDGPLTSRLQNLSVGDEIVMSRKPTGTLVQDHLLPGRNLYLLSTGTGLAPFLSIIKDPEIYENFDRVILTHGVRYVSELAYQQMITEELPNHEYLGELVREKLLYYPTVTREKYRHNGRLTDLLVSGKLSSELGLPAVSPENDRFMLCGSPSMLKEFCGILDSMGFRESRHGEAAHYVIERAFVEQ
ncbi:ferredoxin--NADP reductase [Aestuariirhabdus litorea]|uniref:ferredoxin--NADP(+) reductase n=1 Tax=Aestuariirhabdus litorea TaxID=2528527 RepID=A0A3P3VK38_9GAMM|nr:ferredoxin--NADP reductase [Aestuariirhabdus litorea]RRJ83070.1 ferredoxin--NADP reductase [Aestuariirhabdus litorea]RWW93228.1 ferredoxin--NADP reductase [Endozoicomonadaceae bacterium GTF-13]